MDILTNIVYTILDYSPELLLAYVVVAAIVSLIKRVRRGLRDDRSPIGLMTARLTGREREDEDDDVPAHDPYTAANLLNGYTQGESPTLGDDAPIPPQSLRTPTPLPPGFVRLDQQTRRQPAEHVATAGTDPAATSSLASTGSSVAETLRGLPGEYHVIDDVVIADTAGPTTAHASTAMLDHVVVSPYGVFVIDEKELMEERIEGDVQDAHWRACWGNGRDPSRPDADLFNPIMENIRHIQALAHITGIPIGRFVSLIVFCGDGIDLDGITGRGRLLSSTRGMPYPTRIITRDELPGILAQYRKPQLDEFICQSKTAIIESLSASRPADQDR
ncbi:Nuclease-related domain-containing protein [Bifidobacterium sp. DSM 109960]|uniref:Nuclease-related domain-containing protein n=1 Tax=Bifidobacterium erythrocebi TaxID=2675325 RepID=A0A7Y0HUD6_9BIFI|nr:nuclease-related domain-containing protein [Bifidobacterium sp. DSM 109960]NMM96031.1 Nuclease-related domain-containing protein [Bifidobacterium sp. DSM 109960]